MVRRGALTGAAFLAWAFAETSLGSPCRHGSATSIKIQRRFATSICTGISAMAPRRGVPGSGKLLYLLAGYLVEHKLVAMTPWLLFDLRPFSPTASEGFRLSPR